MLAWRISKQGNFTWAVSEQSSVIKPGSVGGQVTLGGVLEGDLELQIPEWGRRRVSRGEWFLLSDCSVRTEMAGVDSTRGLGVVLPVSKLLGGARHPVELNTQMAALHCPLRDSACYVQGRCIGRVIQLLEELVMWEEHGLSRYWQHQSQMADWIGLILDQTECKVGSCCCNYNGAADIAAVEAVATQLRENLAEAHTIPELARRHFINECKLKVLFRRHFGMTIYSYLREQRMRYARRLLEKENCGVMTAAMEVGYSNASHFARAFRTVHGINPNELRKRYLAISNSGRLEQIKHELPFGAQADVEGFGLSWSI